MNLGNHIWYRRAGESLWKRVVTWVGGILLALIVVVAAGVYVLLHSQKFHNYVLNQARTKASAALNTRVQLQNLTLHFHNLGLDLYGLTVYGTGPGAGRPLLQVDHIGLGVRVISVVHRKWNLDNVIVDHPVADLIVGPDGQNNLPTMQSSGTSNTNVFHLAIRHIALDRGVIYYNDRSTPLDADLNDLDFQSSYSAADNGQYSGTLSYRDGHLQYGSYVPMPHDLKAQFTGNVGGGTITASGGVAYRPAVQFNLALKGSGLRLLYPQTVRTDLGLSLTMTGTTDAALLAGQVNINSISFTPDFDLMSFANQFNSVASPPPAEGFADNVKLNVAVRSTSELNVVSPT